MLPLFKDHEFKKESYWNLNTVENGRELHWHNSESNTFETNLTDSTLMQEKKKGKSKLDYGWEKHFWNERIYRGKK